MACYTVALALDERGQLPSATNRAQAYLTLQQWDRAIDDCTHALRLLGEQEEEEAGGLVCLAGGVVRGNVGVWCCCGVVLGAIVGARAGLA